MKAQNESYLRGWHRGNYGNAYESQDWETWYAEQCGNIPEDIETFDPNAWQAGLLLGFFASYEVEEIADDMLAETVQSLRAEYAGGN